MLARGEAIDGTRRPLPIDQLAALLLFYARDGFAGLRLAADIAAWWDRYGDARSLRALADLAERHPPLSEAWRSAIVVASAIAGLPTGPMPDGLRPRTRRGVLACRLSNWDLRGNPDQIMANVTLVDGLLAPRSDLPRFARRLTTRDTDRVPDAGDRSPWRGAAARERGVHLVKTSVRHAIALARLTGGRSWTRLPPVPRPPLEAARGAVTPSPSRPVPRATPRAPTWHL
jgi:hypothetical protein